MKPWLLAARPKTLLAGIVPVWVGCDLACVLEGAFNFQLALCTLASALCIQVATNFFNDAIDFRKGADGSARLGPTRVTASGLLNEKHVFAASLAVLLLACLFAVPLIAARGWPILAIGIPSLYFSYGYTGGPVPLAYRGLGEFFVILFFGLIAVTGTFFVQTGQWSLPSAVAGFQAGLLSTALIAVNNLRDIEEDRRSGKRTLAVRFGRRFAKAEIILLTVLPMVAGIYWGLLREAPLVGAALAPLLAMPFSAWLLARICSSEPGPVYNKYLALSALQLLLFAILFSAGLRV